VPKTSQKAYTLPAGHLLLALAIVAVWGTNFVVIKLSLGAFPPFLFAALRYTFAFLPLVFFVPRPKVSWVNLCVYGLAVGVGQFGILYFAVDGRISPGLASLVIQTQVFFTIGFAMFFAKERLRTYQMLAVLVALTGLGIIALHTDANTTFLGLALVVFTGFSWGVANTVSRRAGSINMLSYVVWASAFAIPPLFAISFIFEGGWDVGTKEENEARLMALGHGIEVPEGASVWQTCRNLSCCNPAHIAIQPAGPGRMKLRASHRGGRPLKHKFTDADFEYIWNNPDNMGAPAFGRYFNVHSQLINNIQNGWRFREEIERIMGPQVYWGKNRIRKYMDETENSTRNTRDTAGDGSGV
jgi:O-acetylserine/cysteine efflux transporter